MAYTDWKQLASGTQVYTWGSSGKMKIDAKYRYERVGADVKYNIWLQLYKNSSSYFNDDINLTVDLDGVEVAYIHPFKDDSSWPATMDREFTVSNKTTGTTTCTFNLWDAQGTKEFDKYFTYSLEVPPAGSDLTWASCNTNGTATLTAKKYSGDFRDDWFINDINDQIRLDTWSYSGAAGDYTQTRSLSKDTIALLASQQNTTSPRMKAYLQSFQGTTGLGLQSREFTASLTKSTGYIASATIDQAANGNEVLHFYVNISKYSTNHIANRLTLYATDSTNNYRYQIYQGYVINDIRYEVADATAMQVLFDYAGNNNSVYLYGVIDSYATDSTYTVYIGQSAMSMYTVSLGSKTIVGTCSIAELNTNLNTFKASGMENLIFFSRLSSVRYNMSANQQSYSGKTKIYGQDIGFYADNSLISNPYTRNNITSLPTIKAAVGRSIVSQATLTPTGTTLVPYNYPSLAQQNVRCDSQGASAQTGNYIKLTMQASFTDLSNTSNLRNLGTATVSYTITDGESTATGTVTSNLGNITIITKGNATNGFNYKKAATITINFVDQLGNSIATITDTVQPGRPGMYGWKTSDGNNHTTINDELNIDGKLGSTTFAWNGGSIPSTKEISPTTIQNIINEVRYSNGQAGSVSITADYTNNNITIAAGWYNYLYVPHRTGGYNGQQAGGDNGNYGNLFLWGMTGYTQEYRIRYTANSIYLTTAALDAYPIGSIYLTLNNTSPAVLFGGTWQRVGVGRTLVSAGGGVNPRGDTNTNSWGSYTGVGKEQWFGAGELGGETGHVLSVNEIPAHTHTGTTSTNGAHTHTYGSWYPRRASDGSKWPTADNAGDYTTSSNGDHNHTFTTDSTGSGYEHNNIQPYMAVYMWQRTA